MDVSFANVALVSPYLPPETLKLAVDTARPAVVTTNYSDTEIKLGEAEFFLHLLEQNCSHQAVIYFSLSAFLSAARSVTLFLQAEAKDAPGFERWYETARDRLQADALAAYLKDQRDKAVHARYSTIRTVLDLPLYKTTDGWTYKPGEGVGVGFSFDGYEWDNGLTKCREHLALLRELVEEARVGGFLPDLSPRRVTLEYRGEGKPRTFTPSEQTDALPTDAQGL